MAFIPYSYDNGQPLPSQYVPAAAGDVTVGLCMALSGGQLSLSKSPDYIALCDRKGVLAGQVIPAMHITGDMVFEAPLAADSKALKPGSVVDVASDGLSIASTSTTKNVQIISMDGTAQGDLCRCRFVSTKEV
jgi:hypothetical protein